MTVTTNTTRPANTPFEPGEQRSCCAGHAVVFVQNTSNGHTEPSWLVWVEQGPRRPERWDMVYNDEQTARSEARRAVALLNRYGSVDAIERRRTELAYRVADDEETRYRSFHRRPMTQEMRDAKAELSTLHDLATGKLQAELAADLIARGVVR